MVKRRPPGSVDPLLANCPEAVAQHTQCCLCGFYYPVGELCSCIRSWLPVDPGPVQIDKMKNP